MPMDKKWIQELKPGDKVWVGPSNFPRSEGVKTVDRLTATQIILTPEYGDRRYLRANGYERGGGMFSKSITSRASEFEVEKWDKEQADKKAKQDVWKLAEEARKAKSAELSGLFDGCADVRVREQRFVEEIELRFWNITEEKVRKIAEFMKELA